MVVQVIFISVKIVCYIRDIGVFYYYVHSHDSHQIYIKREIMLTGTKIQIIILIDRWPA